MLFLNFLVTAVPLHSAALMRMLDLPVMGDFPLCRKVDRIFCPGPLLDASDESVRRASLLFCNVC